jgi:Flp pilus assembly protein TadG
MNPRRRARCRGNSLIEFALSSTIFILSFSGAFQFGYGFYRYNQLQSAVTGGARYASLKTYRCAAQADIERNKAAVANMVVFGTPAPPVNAAPVVPGLHTGLVDVTYNFSSAGVPTSVRVGMRSMTIDAVFTRFTFTGKPFTTFPYMGRYAPNETQP